MSQTIAKAGQGWKKGRKLIVSGSEFYNGEYIITHIEGDVITLKKPRVWLILFYLFCGGSTLAIMSMEYICNWILKILG